MLSSFLPSCLRSFIPRLDQPFTHSIEAFPTSSDPELVFVPLAVARAEAQPQFRPGRLGLGRPSFGWVLRGRFVTPVEAEGGRESSVLQSSQTFCSTVSLSLSPSEGRTQLSRRTGTRQQFVFRILSFRGPDQAQGFASECVCVSFSG